MPLSLSSARDPLPAAQPLPLALHARSAPDPALRQAPRLPRGREHAGPGEEATQPGGNAGHQRGAEPRIPENGESSSLPTGVTGDQYLDHVGRILMNGSSVDLMLAGSGDLNFQRKWYVALNLDISSSCLSTLVLVPRAHDPAFIRTRVTRCTREDASGFKL